MEAAILETHVERQACAGAFLSDGETSYIPFAHHDYCDCNMRPCIKPTKFAILYTVGNLLGLGSTGFLVGFWNQVKGMFKVGAVQLHPRLTPG